MLANHKLNEINQKKKKRIKLMADYRTNTSKCEVFLFQTVS